MLFPSEEGDSFWNVYTTEFEEISYAQNRLNRADIPYCMSGLQPVCLGKQKKTLCSGQRVAYELAMHQLLLEFSGYIWRVLDDHPRGKWLRLR